MTPHLHSLKFGLSIIVGIKVLVSFLPGLVDRHIPSSRSEGGDLKINCPILLILAPHGYTYDCGLDQDALDLFDVHPPHHGLG